MPDRKVKEHLADWRAAEEAEAATEAGSAERRRAHAGSRRARWAFEDASRLEALDAGGPAETLDETTGRAMRRLGEAVDNAAEAGGRPHIRGLAPETGDQRDKRIADEDEIARELA